MKKTELQSKLEAIRSVLAEPAAGALQLTRMTMTADTMLANLLGEIEAEEESEIGKVEAGAGSRAIGGGVVGAAGTFLPNLDEKIIDRIIEGLDAELNLWDGTKQAHYKVPDTKTRMETVKLYMGYRLGLPPQMRINIEAGAHKDRHAEMLELARTPSGRHALMAMGAIDADWLKKYLPDDSQK